MNKFSPSRQRRKPQSGVGMVAALQVAPRDFHYTVCPAGHLLYFTYVGEPCPKEGCGLEVRRFVEGRTPAGADEAALQRSRFACSGNYHADAEAA